MGDLPGITARLPHLADLGVDAVWLSPFYTSPQNDAGYDVADYRDVDPRFGTLADADAHGRARPRARVCACSSTSCPTTPPASTRGSRRRSPPRRAVAERARYVFREGRGENGDEPPNNWLSNFGGPGLGRG